MWGLSALALPLTPPPPGSWPAPSLSVSADPEAAPGHRTLRCLTPNNGSECLITALLRAGTPDPVQVKEGRENQTDFTLRESSEDRGSYSCVYYQCDWPHLGSSRSSRLEMQATGEDSGDDADFGHVSSVFYAPDSTISNLPPLACSVVSPYEGGFCL